MPLGDSQPRYLSNEDGTDRQRFSSPSRRSVPKFQLLPPIAILTEGGTTWQHRERLHASNAPSSAGAVDVGSTRNRSNHVPIRLHRIGLFPGPLASMTQKRFLEVSGFFQERRTCYILSLPISFFDASCTFPYSSDVYSLDMLHVSHTFSPNHSNAYILMSFNVSYTPALNLIFSLLAFDIILGTQWRAWNVRTKRARPQARSSWVTDTDHRNRSRWQEALV